MFKLFLDYKLAAVGVMALDKKHNVATPFNTEDMYRATRKNGEPADVMIWRDM